jgi:hypothetical protein
MLPELRNSERGEPRIQRANRFFIHSAIIILVLTALAKLLSATGEATVLGARDPLLALTYRQVFLAVASFEIAVVFTLIFGSRQGLKIAIIGWLALNFTLYRAGLYWIGAKLPCGCLGSITSNLGITPETADLWMKWVLSYLLFGSIILMILNRKRREQRHVSFANKLLSRIRRIMGPAVWTLPLCLMMVAERASALADGNGPTTAEVGTRDEQAAGGAESARLYLRTFSGTPPVLAQLYFERFLKFDPSSGTWMEGEKFLLRWQSNAHLLAELTRFPTTAGEDLRSFATCVRGSLDGRSWKIEGGQLYRNDSELVAPELNQSHGGLDRWVASIISPVLFLGIPNVTRDAVTWRGDQFDARSFDGNTWTGQLAQAKGAGLQLFLHSAGGKRPVTGRIDLQFEAEQQMIPSSVVTYELSGGIAKPHQKYVTSDLILLPEPLPEAVFVPETYSEGLDPATFIVTSGGVFKVREGIATAVPLDPALIKQRRPGALAFIMIVGLIAVPVLFALLSKPKTTSNSKG